MCAETLRVIGLFGALDDSALGALCTRLQVLTLAAGQQIYEQGHPGRALYVILSGEVVLTRSTSGAELRPEVEIARYGDGEWFGESSVIDMMQRPHSASVSRNSRVLKLCTADLNALYKHNVKAYALLMMNIARQLSRKLRLLEGRLSDSEPPLSAAETTNASPS